ncbi:MAG TPA: IclR family transcriptional regulator C-terminal domain-containing protein [Aestuariivirgaceae bacterium]|nr:IclR family transcriptional regulator C-terminal domain-containing protein [Aestuariivirgaceae bacterium]
MDQMQRQGALAAARLEEVRLPSKESLRASGQVQSLSRALKLMNALSYHPQGLSLSEVALEVGLPTSTAHRLLTTLQNERFVRFDPERSAWLVGVQAFRVGSTFLRSRDLATVARPFMRRLMEQSGETVNLAIADRGEAVFLAQVECNKVMRAITGPGGRAMLHCSGVGKAVLAHMNPIECEKHLRLVDFRRETVATIATAEALKRELATIAARGYAVDNEETAIGLRCVASPLFNEHGDAIAGLSVSGPTARIPESRIASLGAAVMAVAAEVTQELGGRRS